MTPLLHCSPNDSWLASSPLLHSLTSSVKNPSTSLPTEHSNSSCCSYLSKTLNNTTPPKNPEQRVKIRLRSAPSTQVRTLPTATLSSPQSEQVVHDRHCIPPS